MQRKFSSLSTYSRYKQAMGPLKGVPSLGPVPAIAWIPVAFVLGFTLIVILPVVLTLPESYSCSAKDGTYYVKTIAPPVLNETRPTFICPLRQQTPLQWRGLNYLIYNGNLPTFTFNDMPLEIKQLSDCYNLNLRKQNATSCTTLDTVIPMVNVSQPTFANLKVALPSPSVTPPADFGSCTVSFTTTLVLSPEPIVQAVSPARVCNASSVPTTVSLSGPSFIRYGGMNPKLMLGSTAVLANASNCVTQQLGNMTLELCSTLTFAIIPSDWVPATYNLTVTNPAPFDCNSTTATFSVIQPPAVSSTSPSAFCSGDGGSITIRGSNFAPSANVTLVSRTDNSQYRAFAVGFVDETTLIANYSAALLPAGFYYVVVSNTGDCESTVVPGQTPVVEVRPIVLIFFVDPPVVYNGISVDVTVFTTGLNRDVADAALILGSQRLAVTARNTNSANRYSFSVPANLDSGSWSIYIASSTGCTFTLANALTVTNETTITLAGVEPNYIYNGTNTPFTLSRSAGAEFAPVPRVYLSSNESTSGVSASIEGVGYVDGSTLTGLFLQGLAVGTYNLVVVNPDGAVGYLPNAVTVIPVRPPVIDSIVPSYYTANDPGVINGANFQPNAVVGGQCRDNGTITPLTFTISSSNSTRIAGTFNFGSITFSHGLRCYVRVSNPDGSNFLFSAISTRVSSNNYGIFYSSASLNLPRRGHVAVSIKPTVAEKFLLVLGGDQGNMSEPISSVERAQIDIFSNLQSWRNSKPLPGPLTLSAGATIGRFVYLIGGYNGTRTIDTTMRAYVLDPLEVPVVDISIDIFPNSTLGAGLYLYVVSATYDAADQINPGGESLPSFTVSVRLPALVGTNLQVEVLWSAVPRASGYRIYRSDVPESRVLKLIGQTGASTFSFKDSGQVPIATDEPLPPGSIGEWSFIHPLNRPRREHSVVVVPSPADPTKTFVYAFAGRNSTSFYRDYEYTVLDTSSSPHAIVTNWTVGVLNTTTGALFPGVAAPGVLTLTYTDTAIIPPGDTYLTFFGGYTADPVTVTSTVYTNKLSGNPELGAWNQKASNSGDLKSATANFAYVTSGGWMHYCGGRAGGSLSTTGCWNAQPTGIVGTDLTLPASAWNPAANMPTSRSYSATVLESASMWFIGGFNGTSVVGTIDNVAQ